MVFTTAATMQNYRLYSGLECMILAGVFSFIVFGPVVISKVSYFFK